MIDYKIEECVREKIKATLNFPEMGGILGVKENRIVTEFYHDSTGVTVERNYIPDTENLNRIISDWSRRGIEFVGFVHSHPSIKKNLSRVDIRYAKKIKTYCNMKEILMVLYIPAEKLFLQYIL